MMEGQDHADPLYRYVDEQISTLRNDVLFNEIYPLQEKEASLRRILVKGVLNSIFNLHLLYLEVNRFDFDLMMPGGAFDQCKQSLGELIAKTTARLEFEDEPESLIESVESAITRLFASLRPPFRQMFS